MTLERTIKEKDAVIESKEDEIAQLRTKMEEMASEFGDMLQVRLTVSVVPDRALPDAHMCS